MIYIADYNIEIYLLLTLNFLVIYFCLIKKLTKDLYEKRYAGYNRQRF